MYGTKPAFALVDQHAVNCIIDTVRTNPGQVTIAAIVPCPPGCADALFRLVAQNGQRLVRLAEQVGDFQQCSGLRVQVQHLAVHRMIAARHPVALQHHAHRARAGPQHLIRAIMPACHLAPLLLRIVQILAESGQRLVAQLLNMGADCRAHRVQSGKDRIGQPNVQFRLLPLPVRVGRTVRLGRQDRLALGLAVYLA